MKIEINTIITLINNERYMVLNKTQKDDKNYFLVMGVDEKKEVIQDKVAIFEERKKENLLFVKKVADPNLIIELTNLLKSQL